MPEMQNMDCFPSLIDLVVNAYGRMEEAANVLTLVDDYAKLRKKSKNFGVLKKALAEARGRVRIVCSDVVKNLSKVA
jgi:hypothetical protein